LAVNEYGGGNTPERAPIRRAMKEHGKELEKFIKKLTLRILDGKINKKQALGLIGERVVTWFKGSIDLNLPPPNAPATVKAKGSDHTLVDTGQMRNSLGWEIKSKK
jgi:hypothetical protein